jgi:putative endonuclease
MYYVYVLYSASYGLYYKGFTQDVERRLIEHNSDKSRYTSGKGPWELLILEVFDTKREAAVKSRTLNEPTTSKRHIIVRHRRSFSHLPIVCKNKPPIKWTLPVVSRGALVIRVFLMFALLNPINHAITYNLFYRLLGVALYSVSATRRYGSRWKCHYIIRQRFLFHRTGYLYE